MVMARALYGLKSSGEYWKMMFVDTLHDTDFLPIVVFPGVYCRRARKTNDEYFYELLLVYVNEALCCSHNPELITDSLNLAYDM